ncbi:hypothetical protein ACM66B_000080 [Microbotryomycetes sp. NB124-2]
MDDDGGSMASPGATSSAAAAAAAAGLPKRVTVKRSQRACVQCRKLKKTCVPDSEGSGVPCLRCKKNGTGCVFDKPASSVVEDEGLSRLSTIEATLATQERRLDTIVSSIGQITGTFEFLRPNLHEVLGWIRSNSAGGPATPHSHDAMHQALFNPSSSTTAALNPPQTSTALPVPNPPSLPIFSTSILHPSSTSKQSDSASPAGSTSRLDALAHLAASPDSAGQAPAHVDRFASRLHAPIQALADAADQLQQTGDGTNSGATANAGGGGGGGVSTATSQGAKPGPSNSAEERPKKRARMAMGAAALAAVTPSDKSLDVVAKGIISDRQARALVLLWLKELQPFCSIIDPDTSYATLRSNTFRFNVLLYTAMRAQTGNSVPSKEMIAVAEQVRDAVRHLIFDTAPQLETIQALAILACYHDEPYTLSGHALRLALSVRFETTFELLEEHGWDKTDDRARHLTSQLRLWLYLVFLEFKHTRSTGRLILLRQEDVDYLDDNADRLHTLPFSIPDDRRTVANLKLTFVERRILLKARTFARDDDIPARVAFFNQTRDLLLARHQTYDAKLGQPFLSIALINLADSIVWSEQSAEVYPSSMDWRRRSQMRHYTESIMFLAANTFGSLLFERTNEPEIHQIAQDALVAAQTTVRVVLHSPAYVASVKFCGYLFRVDLVFAALLMLKLARTFPSVVVPADVDADLSQLVELLSETAGSQRFSSILRHAKEEYLASIFGSSPAQQPPNVPRTQQAIESSLYSPSPFEMHSSTSTTTTGDVPPILPPWLASQLGVSSPRQFARSQPHALQQTQPQPLQQQQQQQQQQQMQQQVVGTSATNLLTPDFFDPSSTVSIDSSNTPQQQYIVPMSSNAAATSLTTTTAALLPGELDIDWTSLPREFLLGNNFLESTTDLLDGNWLANGLFFNGVQGGGGGGGDGT